MSDLLKNIEKDIVEDLTAKLPKEDSMGRFMSQVVKISAQVTRTFLERYENEKNDSKL